MALQVWLPLTKDLRNQGLNDVTITNNGATFDSAGKLGGCYSFNGSSNYLYTTGQGYFGNNYTFSAWVYTTSTSATQTVGCIRTAVGSGFSLFLIGGKLRIDPGGNNVQWTTNYTYPANTWFHLVVTYDGSVVKYYINGVLQQSYTTTISSSYWGNTLSFGASQANGSGYGNYLNGKLNDIRVYDHALSQMEVKELAKGLVLHYPLNSNSTYTSLVDKTAGYNIYNNFGADVTYSLTTTEESFLGSPVRRLTATINNSSRISSFQTELWSHGVYNWSRTFLANTKYCFWIYYKPVTHTDVRVGGTASNISGWTEIPPVYVGNGWYRVGQYRDGTVTTDKTDNIFVSFKWTSAAVNTPVSIDFACPTLIQGLTEIQPSINYNMGNIIYDCSGFCNNADLVGTWNISNNTPKYQYCMHLSTTSSKIHISNFPVNGFGNSYSFAWWGKRTSNSPMFWGFSDGCRLNGMYVGIYWNTGDGSSNPIYTPGTTTTITAPSVNVWHHYVMTGDGTTCKLYLDGVLYGQAKTYKAISGTSIYINGWDTSTSYCSDNTDMSDFRIYATALSAADVKSLYQNSAYIDSSGNIYGAVHTEV